MIDLRNVSEPWASVAIVAIISALLVVQELTVRRLSPSEVQDPRLGATAFWIWVAVTAAAIYLVAPLMDRGTWERGIAIVCGLLWIGWKLGIVTDVRGRPREHEEIWATMVGVVLGCFLELVG